MTRRNFLKVAAIVGGGVCLGGCSGLKNEDENKKPELLRKPLDYTIDEASKRYGVSDEAPSVVVKEFLDNTSKSGELIPLKKLQYAREYSFDSGKLVPVEVEADELYGGDSKKDAMFEYAYDANESSMHFIKKYLNGEVSEETVKLDLDEMSYDNLVMMKKLGLTIEDFAVTDAQLLMADGNEDSMYIVNTFSTTEDDDGNSLNGYLRTKLRKHGDMWIADKLLDYEVYTPDGKLGFIYMGSDHDDNGNIAHAWIEGAGADIPLWNTKFSHLEGLELCEAILNHPDPLHVDDFREDVFAYGIPSEGEFGPEGRKQRIKHHTGGRVVSLKKGVVKVAEFPGGNYIYDIGTRGDGFDGPLSSLRVDLEGGHGPPEIGIFETYYGKTSVRKPQGLALTLETSAEYGAMTLLEDGYDAVAGYLVHPSDLVAEHIGASSR